MNEPRYIKAYYNGEWAHGAADCKRLFAKADAEAAAVGPRRPAEFKPRYVIYAHQILANVLMTCDKVLLRDFFVIAEHVGRAVPDANIVATNHSISCALEDYPTMFKRRGDSALGRAPGSAERFTQAEVDLFFNDEMPDGVRSQFKRYFKRLTK